MKNPTTYVHNECNLYNINVNPAILCGSLVKKSRQSDCLSPTHDIPTVARVVGGVLHMSESEHETKGRW